LKKKSEKKENFEQTKIYSKTDVDQELLKKLETTLSVDTKKAKIIIDKNLSAGLRIQSGGKVVDATLETMLEKAIEKLLTQN
jgi:F0F1-type ATP synthase delta subunit